MYHHTTSPVYLRLLEDISSTYSIEEQTYPGRDYTAEAANLQQFPCWGFFMGLTSFDISATKRQ